MTELHAEVPGGALRIRVRGPERGRRVLVLHGGPGLSDTYIDGLIDEFADTDRVATYAQRGVAPSTAGAPFDLDVQADDAIAVLDALGWSDAVVLGHSWGGYLLLHVLAAHPERVLAGVALEPTGAVGDGGVAEFDAELISRLPPEDVERLGEPGLDPDEMLALIWPGYFPRGAVVPPPIPGTVASMETLEAGQIAGEAAQPGLADRLSGLAVPVLFIVGGGSPMPATASSDTAAVIGSAASVVSIGGGHFPWLTGPGDVRAAVDAFLR